ncbi:MAG: SapC family protein [Aestuariivirgaceae bacterium]
MSDAAIGHQAEPSRQGYPLFYQQPEVLRAEVHGELELRPEVSFEFARTSSGIPLNAAEFPVAARDYPIVLVGDETPVPVAIVGLRKNENLMIAGDDTWADGAYVPAYVRRYPFVFVRDQNSDQFALCIDGVCERIARGSEHPFFIDGEPAETTRRALEFCTAFQQHSNATNRICQALREKDLFRAKKIEFTLKSGEKLELRDFRIIDEEKLNALPDDDFIALRQSGALAVIYCHLMSMNSWPALLSRIE